MRGRNHGLGHCWFWSGDRKLASIRNPIFLDVLDAIGERRQELASLVQAKLKKLTLRKSSHNLCFSKLGDKGGVWRHLNDHRVRIDRHPLHVNCRLSVERESDCKGLTSDQ